MAKNKAIIVDSDDDDETPTQSSKSRNQVTPTPAPKARNQIMTTKGPAIVKDDGQLEIETEAENIAKAVEAANPISNTPSIEVAPQIAKSDRVTIVMLREVNPAPVIGHPAHSGYSFLDHGITKLEERKNYVVPKNVANVLVDKGLAFARGAVIER